MATVFCPCCGMQAPLRARSHAILAIRVDSALTELRVAPTFPDDPASHQDMIGLGEEYLSGLVRFVHGEARVGILRDRQWQGEIETWISIARRLAAAARSMEASRALLIKELVLSLEGCNARLVLFKALVDLEVEYSGAAIIALAAEPLDDDHVPVDLFTSAAVGRAADFIDSMSESSPAEATPRAMGALIFYRELAERCDEETYRVKYDFAVEARNSILGIE